MSMKRLMSAAHAAGYAMAAEDLVEPRSQARAPVSTAVVVYRVPQRSLLSSTQRSIRRTWLRMWAADHWLPRAAA